jgi:hypothetical protein
MKIAFIPILLGLLLFTTTNSNAQKLNFGLVAGYDIVNIQQKPWDPLAIGPPYRPRKSFNLNSYISYKSKGIFGLSAEPGFMQKGAVNGFQDCCKWELNYLQMPLLADFYILHGLFLSIGPEFSYMLNAKAVNGYPGPNQTANFTSLYKRFEVSGFIGLNWMITKNIGIGLGYNHGLTHIKLDPIYGDHWEVLEWAKEYTQYWQFRIRFRIQTFDLENK